VRRFKMWVWLAVSLAVWCGSAALASAQTTYDFSFASSSGTVSGSFVVTGSTVTNLMGMVDWQTSPPNPGGQGAFSFLTATGSFTSTSSYSINDEGKVQGGDTLEFNIDSGSNASFVEDVRNGDTIHGTASAKATPGPVPGAGPLSYLAFGLGGLFIKRKRLWRVARMAAGKAV
jgi:hypothetical protein